MKSANKIELGLMLACSLILTMTGCNKNSSTTVKDSSSTAPQSPAPVIDASPLPPIPDIIVEVNGEKYTKEMANAEFEQQLARAAGRIPPDRIEEVKRSMIDQMAEGFIGKTILMAEVNKQNLTATPEEIDQRISTIKSSLKGITFEEILKTNNITEAKVREDLSMDIKINKLFATVTNNITVNDAEVVDFMAQNKERLSFPETVHARHILVASAKTDDDKIKADKKAKAEKLRTEVEKGADFATVAKENSDCPSKEMGGDLGRFPKGRMLPAFEKAAFEQATNVIGPIVETDAGYHIVQVLEHQAAGAPPKEEVSDIVMKQKINEAMGQLFNSLKQKAIIKDNRPPKPMPPMGMGMPGPAPAR